METTKTFIEIFKSSRGAERKELINGLSRKCKKKKKTILSWGYGSRNPERLAQKVIAEYLNSTVKALFPKETN